MSNTRQVIRSAGAALALAGAALWTTTAQSQVLAMSMDRNSGSIYRGVSPSDVGRDRHHG